MGVSSSIANREDCQAGEPADCANPFANPAGVSQLRLDSFYRETEVLLFCVEEQVAEHDNGQNAPLSSSKVFRVAGDLNCFNYT